MILIPVRKKSEANLSRILLYVGLGIVGLISVFLLFLYLIQDNIAFNAQHKSKSYHHPNPSFRDHYEPDELGMTFKDLEIMSPVDSPSGNEEYDILQGWFVYHKGVSNKIPTIVYFHENDYFPPARLYMIEKLYKNPQKYNVVMVDYRGYGNSQGKPSEQGLYNDCHAIMDYVLQMEEIDKDQVFIFGASLGGVMATYSALNYQEQVKGLILQNTIASVKSLVTEKAPYLEPAIPIVLTLKMESDKRIKNIKLPMMFVVGLADKDTGPKQMDILYKAASQSATFRNLYEIPGCDHYLTWYYGGKEYDDQLTAFIDQALSTQNANISNEQAQTNELSEQSLFGQYKSSIQSLFEAIY